MIVILTVDYVDINTAPERRQNGVNDLMKFVINVHLRKYIHVRYFSSHSPCFLRCFHLPLLLLLLSSSFIFNWSLSSFCLLSLDLACIDVWLDDWMFGFNDFDLVCTLLLFAGSTAIVFVLYDWLLIQFSIRIDSRMKSMWNSKVQWYYNWMYSNTRVTNKEYCMFYWAIMLFVLFKYFVQFDSIQFNLIQFNLISTALDRLGFETICNSLKSCTIRSYAVVRVRSQSNSKLR
jgi:hypothetical protein